MVKLFNIVKSCFCTNERLSCDFSQNSVETVNFSLSLSLFLFGGGAHPRHLEVPRLGVTSEL